MLRSALLRIISICAGVLRIALDGTISRGLREAVFFIDGHMAFFVFFATAAPAWFVSFHDRISSFFCCGLLNELVAVYSHNLYHTKKLEKCIPNLTFFLSGRREEV